MKISLCIISFQEHRELSLNHGAGQTFKTNMMKLSIMLSWATLTIFAMASNSFGGVNHYFLATLDQTTRRSIITTLHNSGARFIRTFVRPEVYNTEKGDSKSTWSDIEGPMGKFASPLSSILDHYDDMLYDVYSVSGGQMKVMLGLHDANMIAGYTQPCDAYCQYMQSKGMNWGTFYSDGTIRNAFKTRLYNILRNYPSKNFGGKPWAQLSQVIMAIDLENEPGVGGHDSYVTGTGWICDISTYLKNTVGLSGIGVATGAIGGALGGSNNFPSEVFSCSALDIISIHGYFASSDSTSAGSSWCSLMSSSGSLISQAKSAGKLVLAEEWVYNGGSAGKPADITSQGHALNALGIPWSYWDVMTGSESCSGCGNNEVSLDNSPSGAWSALSKVLAEANTSPVLLDWSRFMPTIASSVAVNDGTCGASSCSWGCLGWNCSPSSPCQGDLDCNSGNTCSACTWGCRGWQCSQSSPCKDQLQCNNGVCGDCTWGCMGWVSCIDESNQYLVADWIQACSSSSPCQGDLDCNGVCKPCTWGW